MDSFFKNIFDNTPKDYVAPEGSQQIGGNIVEPAGGGTGAEPADKQVAQQPEGTTAGDGSKEKWAEHIIAAKERSKSAGSTTREVNQEITNKIKEITSRNAGEEVKTYVKDKIGDARDKINGAQNYFTKDNLLKNYDGITEKAVNEKNSVLERTTEVAKGILLRANEKLVTKPQEATKSFGNDVGRFFIYQGKNVADGINADAYDFKANISQSIADRYSFKATHGRKENSRLTGQENAQTDGGEHKVSPIEKDYQRMAERKGKTEVKYQKYKSGADQARSASRELRAGIAGR
jgi:hypothetical protein